MTKQNKICSICGRPIFDPTPSQKYHQGGCADTAHTAVKLRSAVNQYVTSIIGE